ncbi:MAG: hypothetical protein JO142_14395 [Burkholderiales bacterium]|nr:hypothetical protein [Burkholderiales bacterium]
MLIITLMDLQGPGHLQTARSFEEANAMLGRSLARCKAQRVGKVRVEVKLGGDSPAMQGCVDLSACKDDEAIDLRTLLMNQLRNGGAAIHAMRSLATLR